MARAQEQETLAWREKVQVHPLASPTTVQKERGLDLGKALALELEPDQGTGQEPQLMDLPHP